MLSERGNLNPTCISTGTCWSGITAYTTAISTYDMASNQTSTVWSTSPGQTLSQGTTPLAFSGTEVTTTGDGGNNPTFTSQSTLAATANRSPLKEALVIRSTSLTSMTATPIPVITSHPSLTKNGLTYYSSVTEVSMQSSAFMPVAVVSSHPYLTANGITHYTSITEGLLHVSKSSVSTPGRETSPATLNAAFPGPYVSPLEFSTSSKDQLLSIGLVIPETSTLKNSKTSTTYKRRATKSTFSKLDYFIGSYLPTLAAVAFRILWTLAYNDARLMEPFYRLASDSGEKGKYALSTLSVSIFHHENENPVYLKLISGLVTSRRVLSYPNLFAPCYPNTGTWSACQQLPSSQNSSHPSHPPFSLLMWNPATEVIVRLD